MAFAETSADEQKKQPYKYNGKELDQEHGLNTYDYSARYFDPALPRFTTVDPLAEQFYSWSPYAYYYNNPLKYIDPTGEGPIEKILEGGNAVIQRVRTEVSKLSLYVEGDYSFQVGPRVAMSTKGYGVDFGISESAKGGEFEYDTKNGLTVEAHGDHGDTNKTTSIVKLGIPIPVSETILIGVEMAGKEEVITNKSTNVTESTTTEASLAITQGKLPVGLDVNTSKTKSADKVTSTQRIGVAAGASVIIFAGFDFNFSFGLKKENEY